MKDGWLGAGTLADAVDPGPVAVANIGLTALHSARSKKEIIKK
jgi:hypothetical protein